MEANDRLLTRAEVERMVALHTTTIYRRMRGGTFPLPIQVGGSGSAVRWLQSEILEWIASRPRATGNGAAA